MADLTRFIAVFRFLSSTLQMFVQVFKCWWCLLLLPGAITVVVAQQSCHLREIDLCLASSISNQNLPSKSHPSTFINHKDNINHRLLCYHSFLMIEVMKKKGIELKKFHCFLIAPFSLMTALFLLYFCFLFALRLSLLSFSCLSFLFLFLFLGTG